VLLCMSGLPLQTYVVIGLVTFCLAAIFFGSQSAKSLVFAVVLMPTYFCAFFTRKSNVSGNFSIWCFCACLKKNAAVSGRPTLRSGCAPLRMTSLYNAIKNSWDSVPPDMITFSPFFTNSAWSTTNFANSLVLVSMLNCQKQSGG